MPHDPSRLSAVLILEEKLLTIAIMQHHVLLETIRSGNLNQLHELNREMDSLATRVRAASEERAAALALFEPGMTLEQLAAKLPEPWCSEFRSARARLADLVDQFQASQRRAANLVASVRSYFQGVLSGFTEAGGTPRYGRTGARLRS